MKPDQDTVHKIGSLRQLAGTRHATLTDGLAAGIPVIDVNTGGGLQYTVLPGRGLDIALAHYKGVNLAYLAPQEEVNAAFYEAERDEWLRTFSGGLLTTCGPLNFGPACVDEDEVLGLHGRLSVTPARQVCDLTDVEQGKIEITGTLGQYKLFGEKVRIKRKISSSVGENSIEICDETENMGDVKVPYLMLYHINFGYPFLDEVTKTWVNSITCEGYDKDSQERIESLRNFDSPKAENQELNYLHTMGEGKGHAWIRNPFLKLQVDICFETDVLPFLTQWKCARVRDYVLALEPCSAPCESRAELRQKGRIPWLHPGEKRISRLWIKVTEEHKLN